METPKQNSKRRGKAEIVEWTRAQVAGILDLDPKDIDASASLMSYGLDSSAAIAVTERLSRWLERDVDAALLLDHPSIERLASAIDREAP